MPSAFQPVRQQAEVAMRSGPGQQEIDVLVSLFNQKRYIEAETLARSMTESFPHYGFGWKTLGAVLKQMGRSADALAPMQKAVAMSPSDAEAHSNLGSALQDLGQLDDAVASYRRALKIKPDHANAHYNLGNALKDLGRLDDALASYRRALKIKPDYADAHNNLGVALKDLGRLDDAVASYRRALEIKAGFAEAHYNLGSALQDLRRLDDAVASYRRALEIKPDYVDAHNNLGVVLKDQRKLDESLQHYQRALALAPNNDEVRFNLALLYLLKGDLEQGWAGYEYRWAKQIQTAKKREFAQPHWQGESLEGKTILVWGEQGIGDQIWFAGLVPELIERARRCTVWCAPKLVTLFARSFPDAHVTAQINATNPGDAFDVQVAAGSVARWLRPTLASFPNRPSYLIADPQRVAYWRERLAKIGDGLKVGFCWRSSNQIGVRVLEYSSLSQWGPIFAVPGVHFVNLQYDECTDELARARGEFGITLHHFPEVDMFDDLDETAALMRALDLVISAPTAVGAQAAALGLPCWQMSSEQDWTALGAEHNPWHPTMKCFPRTWEQSWLVAIEQIASELRRVAHAHG